MGPTPTFSSSLMPRHFPERGLGTRLCTFSCIYFITFIQYFMTISHPVGDNSHVITGCRILYPVPYFEFAFSVQTDKGRGQESVSLVPRQDESGV